MLYTGPAFACNNDSDQLVLELAGSWRPSFVEQLIGSAINSAEGEGVQSMYVWCFGDPNVDQHSVDEGVNLLRTTPAASVEIFSPLSVKLHFTAPISGDSEWVPRLERMTAKMCCRSDADLPVFWKMYREAIEAMTERKPALVHFGTAHIVSQRCDVRVSGCGVPADLCGEVVASEITHYGPMVVVSPNTLAVLGGFENVRSSAPVVATEPVAAGVFEGGLFCLLSDTPTASESRREAWRKFLQPVLPKLTTTPDPLIVESNRRRTELRGVTVSPDVLSADFDDPIYLDCLKQLGESLSSSMMKAQADPSDRDEATRSRWRANHSFRSAGSPVLLLRIPLPDESAYTPEFVFSMMARQGALPFLHVEYNVRRGVDQGWNVHLHLSAVESYTLKSPGRRGAKGSSRINELVALCPQLFPRRDLYDESSWKDRRKAHINLFRMLDWALEPEFVRGYVAAVAPEVSAAPVAGEMKAPTPPPVGDVVQDDALDPEFWLVDSDDDAVSVTWVGSESILAGEFMGELVSAFGDHLVGGEHDTLSFDASAVTVGQLRDTLSMLMDERR